MLELRSRQLVYVKYSDFLTDQLIMNMQAILIWIVGLFGLLLIKAERKFRLYGFCFVFLVALIMAGNGKSYYTLGIYPMLFVFGAIFIEKYVKKYFVLTFTALILHMLVSLYISLSFDGIPFMTAERMEKKEGFRWEDGRYYDIPQDMADMTGWKEIGHSVAEIYLNLSAEHADNIAVYCGHYGQAGAVMFYGKDIGIPAPISTNGSFVFWAPDRLSKDFIIYVHSDLNNEFKPEEQLPQLFNKVERIKTINNPYFRENGTRIYLCSYPTKPGKDFYEGMIDELKRKYNL
jgi:hypothetical protein